MVDIRPVIYIIGRILIVLGIVMLVPALVDLRAGTENGTRLLSCVAITGFAGALLSMATANVRVAGLDTRQAYLLTAGIWLVVPGFGALPYHLGAPGLNFTHAYFESVSGFTTTGATVIVGLDGLPDGMNLWRGMTQYLGGLGIAFIAMIFLPLMRVGGMQFFRQGAAARHRHRQAVAGGLYGPDGPVHRGLSGGGDDRASCCRQRDGDGRHGGIFAL
jgi:trk system potassium uptake protein